MVHALALALNLSGVACPPDYDPDSDGDGLTDFMEVHKYFTDPAKPDSDGDGIADGDWAERREYAYTVRRLLHVLPPVTPDVLCDDYQDARITDETPGYVELEVIHYPFNTVADSIRGDPHWRATARRLPQWTRPGITANWDPAMRAELVRRLTEAGIDPETLDDKSLVERASQWLLEHAQVHDGFTTFASRFENGRATLHPDIAPSIERGRAGAERTLEEEWQRELFAKGMFEHGVRGTCTSTAIYLNGCLRALGIPTRIVLCVPAIDTSDPREPFMLAHLRNGRVRDAIEEATEGLGESWTSHTFNEVFVGGRWRRLNFDRLGQNTLDPHCLGLMTHVATFSDWADGRMAETWGLRQARSPKDDAFGGTNPYSTIALSDRAGEHAPRELATPTDEITERTIDRLWWFDEHPAGVDMRLDDPATAGHLVFHVKGEPTDSRRRYKRFYEGVSKRFVLRADGHADVPANATRGYWLDPAKDLQHFYLRIEPDQFSAMALDVPYRLEVVDSEGTRRWRVADAVTIVRRSGATPAAAASPPGSAEAVAGAGAEEIATLALGPAYWSDAADSPTGPLPVSEPVILVRMGPSAGFDAHKRFTEAADLRFFLEAPGAPTLKVGAGVGGVTTRDASYLVVQLGPADWHDLRRGVEYTIRAQNANETHRWSTPAPVKVRRE